MNTTQRTLAILAVPALLLAIPAMASMDDIKKPAAAQGERVPIAEVLKTVEAAGYTNLREVEYEHPVYEVEAFDKQGRPVEVYVHATSGKILGHELDD